MKIFKKIMDGGYEEIPRVCLDIVYFIETENLLLKVM